MLDRQTFRYSSCRNISGPEDDAVRRRIYRGHAPASAFVSFGPADNARVPRPSLDELNGRSQVRRVIRKSLRNRPADFCVLNRGLTLQVRSASIDDSSRTMVLEGATVVDGRATQAEIRRWFADGEAGDTDPSVRFEIVVSCEDGLGEEITLARNTQTDDRRLRGQHAADRLFNAARMSGAAMDTELDATLLAQLTVALLPQHLFEKLSIVDGKAALCRNGTGVLRKLDGAFAGGADIADVQAACIDLAPHAARLYTFWRVHPSLLDLGGASSAPILDGVLFPIVAAHAAFTRCESGTWMLPEPSGRVQRRLATTARIVFTDIVGAEAAAMGSSVAAHRILADVTSLFAELSA